MLIPCQEAELLVNIMDSVFVPEHQVLLPEEKDALMAEHSIPEGKLEVNSCMQSCITLQIAYVREFPQRR